MFPSHDKAPLLGLSKELVPYDTTSSNLDMSVTYGYAPRYAELKSARDYFEGGFCGSYSSWVTGYDDSFLRSWRLNKSVNSGSELPGEGWKR